MKIAVSSTGQDLSSPVDPRFGRCQYFIIVDPKTMKFKAIQNPNVAASGGAGIQTAQLVANEGAEVVLTGACGPNAFQVLSQAGIKVIVGASGIVQESINAYKSGKLQPTTGPSVGAKFGMGMGPGSGMGMGRGMGMGKGMGMGRGMGMGWQQPMGLPPQPPQAPQTSKGNELKMLEDQAQMLKQQMDQIQKRIAELSKKKKKKKK